MVDALVRCLVHRAAVPGEFVWNVIGRAGVDFAQAEADLQNSRITEALRLDREDLVAPKVKKTPEFFVNGNPCRSSGRSD